MPSTGSQPITVTPGLAYLRTVSDQSLWSWASSWTHTILPCSTPRSFLQPDPSLHRNLASSRCLQTSRPCSSTALSSLLGLLPTPNSDEVCLHLSLSLPSSLTALPFKSRFP